MKSSALPPLPSDLRSLTPFIQRADELRNKEPIMAYWCTYYAAQLGLDLKSQQHGARDYLFALITRLEDLKKELGSNDAIDHESAGAAYVENFALKVFAMADNEDRIGSATRSTAKKFLAAANFLELLKVFVRSNNAQVNEEKIRYAKWKAADIAKAFREGRQPTPGSAGEASESSGTSPAGTTNTFLQDSLNLSSVSSLGPNGSPKGSISSDATLAPGPVVFVEPHTPPKFVAHLPPDFVTTREGMMSPGNWSTAATPGTDSGRDSGVFGFEPVARGRGGYLTAAESPVPTQKKGTVSEELEGCPDDKESITGEIRDSDSNVTSPTFIPYEEEADQPALPKKVHFTPSVEGGLSSAESMSVPEPQAFFPTLSTTTTPSKLRNVFTSSADVDPRSVPLPENHSPPASAGSVWSGRTGNSVSPTSMPTPIPPHDIVSGLVLPDNFVPALPSPPQLRHSPPRTSPNHSHVPPPPPVPPQMYVAAQPTYSAGPRPAEPHRSSRPPMELTPLMIAKAQKHSRFAISALDYEDAEQARKELRAALAVLGDYY